MIGSSDESESFLICEHLRNLRLNVLVFVFVFLRVLRDSVVNLFFASAAEFEGDGCAVGAFGVEFDFGYSCCVEFELEGGAGCGLVWVGGGEGEQAGGGVEVGVEEAVFVGAVGDGGDGEFEAGEGAGAGDCSCDCQDRGGAEGEGGQEIVGAGVTDRLGGDGGGADVFSGVEVEGGHFFVLIEGREGETRRQGDRETGRLGGRGLGFGGGVTGPVG